jgi:hypothetical protein
MLIKIVKRIFAGGSSIRAKALSRTKKSWAGSPFSGGAITPVYFALW